jgi:hypothetical protein
MHGFSETPKESCAKKYPRTGFPELFFRAPKPETLMILIPVRQGKEMSRTHDSVPPRFLHRAAMSLVCATAAAPEK